MPSYEPTSYWKALLGASFDESGVGYPHLARALNRGMYRSFEHAVALALHRSGVSPRGARVLDIGCGTGIWIDFWRRQGAIHISGADLTEASAERLRKAWPDYEFQQADIGEAGISLPGENDIVSAMSVLLHIIDEDRFDQAFVNLAAALRPGGALVLVEPAITHRWWGARFGEDANSKARPLSRYEQAMDAVRLRLQTRLPATVLLANVVDTRTRSAFYLFQKYWNLLGGVGQDERRGKALAAVLSPLDLLATRLTRNGPSAKVLIARRA